MCEVDLPALWNPNDIDLVALFLDNQSERRLTRIPEKSESMCAASVNTARLEEKYPPVEIGSKSV